ncbi:AI-2E family transporter [Novosphingobium sp. PASSN1]|uniref:AI-2E family transporter n=1 Tax=Novosphingobium sp. PASSN1 TaxID=2015561 RepID=UPI000BD7E312|nr:AI-2E family transporter [Novosphingobium sp. PASSN1]OYU35062.1 MAG: AI-2E family transporter [Novosphingobium sp. PASSN1]
MSDETTPAPRHASGPTDIRDDLVRQEVKRAAVWLGMGSLLVLAVYLAHPLLVIFGGFVFAMLIDGGQRLLGRVLPIGRGWRVAVVLLLTVAFLVWVVEFAGSQIMTQAAEMPPLVTAQAQRALDWAGAHGLTMGRSDVSSLLKELLGGVGQVTQALGGLFGGVTTLLIMVILGIYFVLEPDLYQRGLAWMLPAGSREYFHGTTHRMGRTLRMLLAGRMLGMVIEGVATWVALAVYGVPMAALLGLLTGLLVFLPNIGAPISGILMILVGFSGGTAMGIYCIIVYVVIQTVDGNIIVPMVAKRTADLAPALVLGAQLIFGVLFGILGLALADPLVVMLKIALERQAEHNTRREELAG